MLRLNSPVHLKLRERINEAQDIEVAVLASLHLDKLAYDLVLANELLKLFTRDVEELEMLQHFVLLLAVMRECTFHFLLKAVELCLKLLKEKLDAFIALDFESVEVDLGALDEADVVWDGSEVRVDHSLNLKWL